MAVFNLHFVVFSFFCLSITSLAVDTLTVNRSIKYNETIVSANGSFELGFFSPQSSDNHYVGIWCKEIPTGTVVWVANRNNPLNDTNGELFLAEQGNLILYNGTRGIVWSINSSRSISSSRSATDLVAQLLDTGNFVIKRNGNGNVEDFVWQSFDYPTDTLLPSMKFGIDLATGINRYLTSWKNTSDPSTGDYTDGFDSDGLPEVFLKKGSEILFRTGHWNGLGFSGLLSVLALDGAFHRLIWDDQNLKWRPYLNAMTDNCDMYAVCGAHGSCSINNSPTCRCLKGFVPKYPNEWEIANWAQGCVRNVPLSCEVGEDFIEYPRIKLPDSRHSWFNRTMDLKQCRDRCLGNCTCTAFANFDVRDGGSGCILWFGDLIDIREFEQNGQTIYVRMAASEIGPLRASKEKKRVKIIITVYALEYLSLAFASPCLPCGRKRATSNFSPRNKLGQGGFGEVYKGILENGQEIAVKRLSKKSCQGIVEFKNEVLCISKLQHRNLVKLLGCCIEPHERIVVYEFMPNKSLDSFIFDEKQSILLDWPTRDLKAGNVLLDYEMNPKISDFGLARSFGGDETEANTHRVVGTYGYMSPEYTIDGLFSIKSDVFSFGVLVLEIVTGRRNRGFSDPDRKRNLVGHAWRLFNEGRSLIDERTRTSCEISEVLRSIQVGLLCVQRRPKDRPCIAAMVLMLRSEISSLLRPKKPGYFAGGDVFDKDDPLSTNFPFPSNSLTITLPGPR
ncbi:G-type lectin S-receptor-like serine/threonine-protein kinase [Hibiscus syriacus]|uniref:Receptor-like serine/threonine-protein kinase n=1 Tax=Hibiscus syriacus TaxID=106335 RepID=A0A6A2XAZ8_HIBSY|nr:G-type lectin S-receptor-like serine/threonine-protein kinase [Hibiscus syriacus]